jgi:hypothetical protein
MNKPLIFLFCLLSLNVFSQIEETKKFRMSTEYGYFNSSFFLASNNGSYLSGSFGYKINEEFWLNLELIKITSTGNLEPSPLLINTPSSYNSTIINPNFSKYWSINEKITLSGSLGGALIFETANKASIISSNGQLQGIEFENQGEPFNFGLFFSFSVMYSLSDSIYAGLNFKSYLPMYLELESFLIGPSIEMRF